MVLQEALEWADINTVGEVLNRLRSRKAAKVLSDEVRRLEVVAAEVDTLIQLVIKQQEELNLCKKETAQRCVEIAKQFNPHPEHEWLAGGIAEAIIKEFDLK